MDAELRGLVVDAVEAAAREVFAGSVPVTDDGWREDAATIADRVIGVLERRSAPPAGA